MAYSYDDFLKAANTAGMADKFSQEDLQIAQRSPEFGLSMLKLMQDSAGAQTQEAKLLAEEAAKQLRASYGNYAPQISETLGKLEGYQPFEYAGADRYKELLESVTNPQSKPYDPTQDPVWSAYKKNYLREGERASQNAITQASVATGGVPSSYAVTAATQAGNYYADKLSQMIPTLAENEYARRLQALSSIQSDRAFDYQKYLDQFSMLGSKLNAFQGQAATEYQKQLDAFEKALAQYQLLGYATPEIAAILGIPSDTTSGASGGDYSGSYSVGAGYDNGSLSGSDVALLQNYMGLSADGKWGPQSQAKAMEMFGVSSVDDVWQKLLKEANGENLNKIWMLPYPEALYNIARSLPQDKSVSEVRWNQLVNQFGEEAVMLAGIKKQVTTAGSTGSGPSAGMKWFESYMMSPQLFTSGGNKAYLGGQSHQFASYADYTLAMVDYALKNNKITTTEAKQLIQKYGIG